MALSLSEDQVRSAVDALIRVYSRLPHSCKPTEEEFSVLAGCVFLIGEPSKEADYQVISVGMGTKCVGRGSIDAQGTVLHDSHAEVLARRGAQLVLYEAIEAAIKDPMLLNKDSFPLCRYNEERDLDHAQIKFSVKPHWHLCMVISASPCGSASIYSLSGEQGTSFTGAKYVSSEDKIAGQSSWIRENIQDVDCVRVKSGKSTMAEAQRTFSMSCSDKLALWGCLGVQGALLSYFTTSIPLAVVIVSNDPRAEVPHQSNALQRSLVQRVPASITSPMVTHITSVEFPPRLRHTQRVQVNCKPTNKHRPAPLAVNWHTHAFMHPQSQLRSRTVSTSCDGSYELTLGGSGARQGTTRKRARKELETADIPNESFSITAAAPLQAANRSRLCKAAIFEMFLYLRELLTGVRDGQTYGHLKRLSVEYQHRKTLFTSAAPFDSWLGQDTNRQLEEFTCEGAGGLQSKQNRDHGQQHQPDTVDEKCKLAKVCEQRTEQDCTVRES